MIFIINILRNTNKGAPQVDIQLNTIIKYFAQSSIHFSDLFTSKLHANCIDGNRFTAPYCNGLVLTLSGEATFSLNGERYIVNSNTLLHAGPLMAIEIQTASSDWEYIVIHYKNYNDVVGLSNMHFSLDIGEDNKIGYFLQQFIQFNKLPGDLVRLKCQLFLTQLIETILLSAKMKTSTNLVEQALMIIAENFDQQITVNEIAESVGCERRKFTYLFEKQIGMSPIQYLTEYRLKQAKIMLRSTAMPVSKIAELVGYSDAYYFCRVFKKHYHMTPSNFRYHN